jgi:DNA-binding CsgD family transcriptional regulator
MQGSAGPRLLERDALIEALAGSIDDAAAGQGSLTLVVGEAGIGKTSLLDVAAGTATRRRLQVLRGRGAELERSHPYGLLRQALDRLVLSIPVDRRGALFSGAAAPAAAIVLGGSTGELSAAEPGAVPRAFYWLLAELASERPVALVLDDLHWSDVPTLELLDYLARRLDDLSIVVLAAARPAESATPCALLPRLTAATGVRELRPQPLSEVAVGEAVAERFADDPDPAFVAACHVATGGNPFLLSELLIELNAQSLAPSAAEAGRVGSISAPGIVHSVLLRLGRMPSGAVALARAAAVLGDGTPLALGASLAGLDERDAASHAKTLSAVGVLAADERLRFTHPLIRAAVYDDVGFARDGMHRAAATMLVHAGAPAEQVASHAVAAPGVLLPELRQPVQEAAAAALERGAPEIACALLRRMLDGLNPGEERADVQLALGRATLAAGDAAGATAVLREAVERFADPRAAATAALVLGRATMMTGDLHGAVELLDAARNRWTQDADELSLALEVEAIGALRFGLDTRGHLSERLRRLAPEVEGSGPDQRRFSAHMSFEMMVDAADRDQVLDVARRAFGDGALLREEGPGSPLVYMPVWALTYSDAFGDADRYLEMILDASRRLGSQVGFSVASALQATSAFRRGDLLTAEAAARAAMEREGAAPLDQPLAIGVLLETLVEQGRIDEAITELEPSGGLASDLPEFPLFTPLVYARGRLRAAAGDSPGGLADLLETGRRAVSFGSRNPFIAWRTAAAPLLEAAGRRDESVELAEEEVERARAFGAPRALGMALRGRALLERGAGQEVGLLEAVAVLERSDAKLELARALVDLGAAQRRTRQRAVSREQLGRGRELAERCRARALVERATTELLAAGARPRRIMRSGADALTASERRVAQMAAGGLTNRAIAQSLFVTVKTVETHLSRVYQKLDIGSRGELAAAIDGADDIDRRGR